MRIPLFGPLNDLFFDEERHFPGWLVILHSYLVERLFLGHLSTILYFYIKSYMEYSFFARDLNFPEGFLLAIGIPPEWTKGPGVDKLFESSGREV